MNVLEFQKMKDEGRKISMVTCYDYSSARAVAESSIDCILVGDSVAMTLNGTGSQIRLFALHVDFRPDLSLTLVRGQDGAFHAATGANGRPSLVVETVNGKVAKNGHLNWFISVTVT